MVRTTLLPALAACLATLLTASRAPAWGGMHSTPVYLGADGYYHELGEPPTPPTPPAAGLPEAYSAPRPDAHSVFLGHPYGSREYPYYGGYLDDGVFATGLRTGVWGP